MENCKIIFDDHSAISDFNAFASFTNVNTCAYFTFLYGQEEIQNLSTVEKGDDLIRVLRELTAVQRKIADLQVELQGRKVSVYSGELFVATFSYERTNYFPGSSICPNVTYG